MSAVYAASAEAIEACGDRPGLVCEWVLDQTSSERWARLADWLVARPFRVAAILFGAWLLNRLVRRAINRSVAKLAEPRGSARQKEQWAQRAATLGSVSRSATAAIIYTVAGIACLGELSIDLGPFVAGAGIAGVALGFGAQSLVRDFLAGSFILIESQYGVGDVINVGDVTGTVERVTLRTTVLRDAEEVLWTIPNGEIRRVANRSQRLSRATVDFRVAYDTDIDQAEQLLRQAADQLWSDPPAGATLFEAPAVLGIERFADNAIVLRVQTVAPPEAQPVLARELRARVKRAFDGAGITAVAHGR